MKESDNHQHEHNHEDHNLKHLGDDLFILTPKIKLGKSFIKYQGIVMVNFRFTHIKNVYIGSAGGSHSLTLIRTT